MIQLIGDDRVLSAENGLKESRVGIKTGRVEDGVFHAQEVTHSALQRFVDALRAANKAYRCRTETPLVQAIARGLYDLGVVRQAEIVVRTHVDDIGATLEGDVVFLVRGDHPLGLPQPCRFDFGDFCGVAVFGSEVTHISLSNPESLCPIVRSA